MKKTTLASLFIGFMSIGSASATPFNIEMVADNDFAIFSGTSTSINNVLYQNDVVWWDQISSLSSLDFNLAAGDDKFYVLGMGGGGQENISGLVNGVNMTDASVSASMSSNISSFLTGYNATDVAYGTYNALLADVQNAFTNSLTTWSDAALNINTTETVIANAGFGSGFRFNHLNAHLFSFDATDVNVEPVPEPSILALMGLGLAGLAYTARRRKLSA